MSAEKSHQNIIVEQHDKVGLIRLNRPQALNALNAALMEELARAVDEFELDDTIACMVITGSDKAFAAGADIKEMADKGFRDVFLGDFAADWHRVAAARKPIVGAVAGFALGGGCELAMQCDVIVAADNAKFGQPEIKLGIIPGIGGTQRLTRVVPVQNLLDEALKIAATIASMSLPSVLAAKEAVNRALETPLAEGVRFERRIFHSLFATHDQKEGMRAFVEKRAPKFLNE